MTAEAARTVDPGEQRTANGVLSAILPGARLEAVTFRSRLLTMGFFNDAAAGSPDRPAYVWVGTIAAAVLAEAGAGRGVAASGTEAFQQGRGQFLPAVYRLLGEEVTAVSIAEDGALTLEVGRQAITLLPDADEPDEIWSVTSDTPEALGDHRWRVTLSNSGRLVVKQPAR